MVKTGTPRPGSEDPSADGPPPDAQHVRAPNPGGWLEELRRRCSEMGHHEDSWSAMTDSPPRPPETLGGRALPVPFRRFLELYRAGRFWDSHEALEDAWRASGSDFYQGLILYASAWVHRERRNAHGVRAQLRKAMERLDTHPVSYLGLDVAEIRAHCVAVRKEVAGNPDGWPDRVAPLPLFLSADRLWGDEVELED